MDVVLVGRNELVKDGSNHAYSKAAVTSKGKVFTASELVDSDGNSLYIDSVSGALAVIPYEHTEVHSGTYYTIKWAVTVPAGDILDLRLVTPNTTKWLHMQPSFFTEAEFVLSVYSGITITNTGTTLPARNRNHNSTIPSGLITFDYIINTSEANANIDTNITAATLGAMVHTGSGKTVGGQTAAPQESILKQNNGYCWRLASQSVADKYVNFEFNWYEHTSVG